MMAEQQAQQQQEQEQMQQMPKEATNASMTGDAKGDADDPRKILDQEFYYYQTKTGDVSKSPLSTRQLIRLLCPVREGLNPILPPTTQCLRVPDAANGGEKEAASSYGAWEAATTIAVLREAACQSWFWTIDGSPPGGPGSCRKLLEVVVAAESKESEKDDTSNSNSNNNSNNNSHIHSRVQVFANGITPVWTTVSASKHLRLVLQALADSDKTRAAQQSNAPSGESVAGSKEKSTEGNEFDNNNNDDDNDDDDEDKNVQNELEAFLSSATGDHHGGSTAGERRPKHENNDEDHLYESDGGTRYVKDPLTGNWIHEALAPKPTVESREGAAISSSRRHNNNNNNNNNTVHAKSSSSLSSSATTKKSKKARFAKRNAKLWIYVSGLPKTGVTEDDLQRYFSRAGMLDLDPETLRPKLKLYKNRATGELKGDASLRYARPESVELALQILDQSLWDQDHRITVERAKFEEKRTNTNTNTTQSSTKDATARAGITTAKRKRPISEAQRKVARLALLQAQDEGFGGRLAGGRKGLCIIVVKNLLGGIPEDRLEPVLDETFAKFGSIEKITCISRTNVVIVKYAEPIAASNAIEALHGTCNPRTDDVRLEAIYWDGITDYTTVGGDHEKELEEEERRHEEFGNWLESQDELPPEFQLQMAEE